MAGDLKIVLDTCALIWWSLAPDKLFQPAKEAFQQMEQDKNGLVPSIAIWEIAIKIKNNKLDLGVDIATKLRRRGARVGWSLPDLFCLGQ